MRVNELKHHFLVAMPHMDDSIFKQSVVYLYGHDNDGAQGVIINKPLTTTLDEILSHLSIEHSISELLTTPVYCGGPVDMNQGLIVARPELDSDNAFPIISSGLEQLNAIAEGDGPEQYMVTLGQSEWSSGQLETEIKRNDWLVLPYNDSLMFDSPPETIWSMAMAKIGIQSHQVASLCGHA